MTLEDSTAAARQRLGRVVGGRWRIDALLGIGGMGWVYAATHKNLHRVAIKMLVPELSLDPKSRERFLREGYVANAVGHPGAVKVFDDGVDEDRSAFLVMELLDGGDLNALRAARAGRIDVATTLAVADQVLDVLCAAHEKSIVHRDIKPGNVFVTRKAEIKLLDFGIAGVNETRPRGGGQSGSIIGSLAYMAPEQAAGEWERIDGRTDLWALGATLFRVLSGERVHLVADQAEQLLAAASRPARSLESVAPELPRAVVELVDRALAFAPSDRWPSAREMRFAVLRAQKELGNPAPAFELVRAEPPEGSSEAGSDAPTRDAPLRGKLVLDEHSRSEALRQLEHFAISGSDVHFIDTIPLLEMIWADDQVQSAERRLLDGFLEQHVRNINELAGRETVTVEQAQAFVERFLHERPAPELLETLRGLMIQVRLTDAPPSLRDLRRRAVLDMCLDIGASCVAAYPHGDHERFCRAEKQVFERIFRALSG